MFGANLWAFRRVHMVPSFAKDGPLADSCLVVLRYASGKPTHQPALPNDNFSCFLLFLGVFCFEESKSNL